METLILKKILLGQLLYNYNLVYTQPTSPFYKRVPILNMLHVDTL